MMDKRERMADVTFKLQFQGSDGRNYTVDLSNPSHVDWLHQRLGICPLKARVQDLERRMEEAEKPARKQRILDLLKDQLSGRTEGWIKREEFQSSIIVIFLI